MARHDSEVRDTQFRKVRADPASYYAKPGDVVTDDRFETSQKIDILRQWGEDLLKLDPDMSAADRNRSQSQVRHVARAIEELGAAPDEGLKARAG